MYNNFQTVCRIYFEVVKINIVSMTSSMLMICSGETLCSVTCFLTNTEKLSTLAWKSGNMPGMAPLRLRVETRTVNPEF